MCCAITIVRLLIARNCRNQNKIFERKNTTMKPLKCIFLIFILGLPAAYAAPGTCPTVDCCKNAESWGRRDRNSNKEKLNQIDPRYGKIDNIFKLRVPLLFAHRGGAMEAPESTMLAFDYAWKKLEVDVLELDVQLAKDGEFVVWHGPSLDNVYIKREGVPNPILGMRPNGRRNIDDFDWEELKKVWVADPGMKDVSKVHEEDGRKLMLLSEFLQAFPDAPLNIEMKSTFKNKVKGINKRNGLEANIRAFLEILDKGKGNRTIVVVSSSGKILNAFRDITKLASKETYPTGLSLGEGFKLLLSKKGLDGRAVETPYLEAFSGKDIVEEARSQKGATFPFLTGFFPFPALDKNPTEKEIFEILDRGVDGVMTDRPGCIQKIIDKWIRERSKGK